MPYYDSPSKTMQDCRRECLTLIFHMGPIYIPENVFLISKLQICSKKNEVKIRQLKRIHVLVKSIINLCFLLDFLHFLFQLYIPPFSVPWLLNFMDYITQDPFPVFSRCMGLETRNRCGIALLTIIPSTVHYT